LRGEDDKRSGKKKVLRRARVKKEVKKKFDG
jgi:hypothetical protein